MISKNFTIELTFSPEQKLTGTNLKRAVDDYYDYARGTTKKVKSSFTPEEIERLKLDGDPKEPRYKYGTKIFKIFNKVEYKGTVVNHDPETRLYKILYEDGDSEDMWHNEMKEYQHSTVKRLPKKKRYKKRREIAATNFIRKYAPSEMDSNSFEDHVMSLSIADIRAIASIRHYDDDDVDLTEEEMPAEVIKLCINTLNSDHITPEEQSLGFYTRKKLKRLTNWNDWKAGETKQIKQFMDQGMFGDPIDPSVLPLPDGAVILCPH